METGIEWTTRRQWLDIIAKHPAPPDPVHRREHTRGHPAFQWAKVAFEKAGAPIVRPGTVLDASTTGIMIRQREEVDVRTLVIVRAVLDNQDITIAGQVMHCTQTVGGYKIGIELRFLDEPE